MTQISERLLVQAHLDAKQPKPLTEAQALSLRAQIAAELKARDAVLVAHFPESPEASRDEPNQLPDEPVLR